MGMNRRYGEACAIAASLDLVGERWALLIVRELLLGPKRFTDIEDGLPGAGSKVLAQRLRELEAEGVVVRRTLPPPSNARVYELTEWGAELDTAVTALGRWGARLAESSAGRVSADSVVLKLRSYFAAPADEPWTATYELRLGRHRFRAGVADGRLVVRRGEAQEGADAIVETDPETLNRIVGGRDGELRTALDDGRLNIIGDHESGRRLLAAAAAVEPSSGSRS